MRPVDNKAFKKNPRDLFLNDFLVRFGKEVEQNTAKVVGMAIGVAQLVCNGAEEVVAPLGVEVDNQLLEDVHERAVRDGAGTLHRLALQLLDSADSDVEHQRVDDGEAESASAERRIDNSRVGCQALSQAEQEGDGSTVPEVVVNVRFQVVRHQRRTVLGENRWRLIDFRQQVHLEVGREGVRQTHVPGERAQNKIAQLNAWQRNHIRQAKVVAA